MRRELIWSAAFCFPFLHGKESAEYLQHQSQYQWSQLQESAVNAGWHQGTSHSLKASDLKTGKGEYLMLVHNPQDPSFSGELSVSTGVRPLPLALTQHRYTEMQFSLCSLRAPMEREILHTAAASISRVCRDAAGSSPTQQTYKCPGRREPPQQVGLQAWLGSKEEVILCNILNVIVENTGSFVQAY